MTHRIADQLAATLAGMLIGILMVGAIAPDAWVPVPRPSQHADPGPGTPGMTTELRLPSPDDAGRTGAPSPITAAAIGTRPAPPTAAPDLASLRGIATWYRYYRGQAAAGPALRLALGARWRGQLVEVSANGRTVVVRLTDWCACGNGRVVDLDRRDFAVLAPPSVGVLRVTVRLASGALPDTATGG